MVGLVILGVIVLVGFLIWLMRDVVVYAFEILFYAIRGVALGGVQAAVSVVNLVDELIVDLDIGDEPILRAVVVGVIGFALGFLLLMIVSASRGAFWVPGILIATTGIGLVLGLVADPDGDWSVGAFPEFGRGSGRPDGPLNL